MTSKVDGLAKLPITRPCFDEEEMTLITEVLEYQFDGRVVSSTRAAAGIRAFFEENDTRRG